MGHNADMMRRVGIVVAWSVATLVAMTIAGTAVGSVRGQVTDVPAIPTAGTAAFLTTTTIAPAESSTASAPHTTDGTTPPPTEVAASTASSTTTTTTTATTTTTTTPVTTPTTTSPPPPTTTTSAPAAPAVTTYTLIGGQVTISALEPDVGLVAAVPTAGFSAEIDESGPGEVEIEFESSDHQSSFRARWKDGALDIEIDEEPEDD